MAIVRARHSAVYPARFMLVAATNPCPCGYAGEHERCRCAEADMARHRRRLNGPLVDRIDLLVSMQRATPQELHAPPCTTSAHARELVFAARERQAARFRRELILVNAHMDGRMLRRYAGLDDAGERLLANAQRDGTLSARGVHRVLRVARTLADLSGAENLTRSHVGQAISLRADAVLASRRAA